MSAADDVTLTFEQYAATRRESTWLASPEFAERADALFRKMELEPVTVEQSRHVPQRAGPGVPLLLRHAYRRDSKGGRTMTMGSDVCCICGEHLEEDTSNNADPVDDGECCKTCNEKVVLPARLREISHVRLLKAGTKGKPVMRPDGGIN